MSNVTTPSASAPATPSPLVENLQTELSLPAEAGENKICDYNYSNFLYFSPPGHIDQRSNR